MLREKLQDASIEAPEGVWEAIAGQLDSMPQAKRVRRRPVVIWGSVLGGAVAVAAAVALAVVFNSRQMPVDIIPQTQELAYSDVHAGQTVLPEDIKPQSVQPSYSKVTPSVDSEPVKEEVPQAVPAGQIAEETTPEVSPAAPAKKPSRPVEDDDVVDNWEDPFSMPEAQNSKGPKVSLSLFGDAAASASNGKSASTKQRAPRSNLPLTTTIEESSASKYALPLTFGLGTKISFNDKWALGTGLSYSYLSRTFDGRYTQVDDEGEVTMKEDFTGIRNSQHYLGIPLYGYYNFLDSRRFQFYAYAGGVIEKCLSNKFYMNGASGRYIHSSKAVGVQLSVAGGLGCEYDFTKFMGIYLDPSIRYYFNMDQPKSIRTQQPLNFGLELGLRFKL